MKTTYQSAPRHLSTGRQASLSHLEGLLDLSRGWVCRHNRLNPKLVQRTAIVSLVGDGGSESHVEALLRGDERKSSTSMAPRLSRPVLPYCRNLKKGLCSLAVVVWVNAYNWKIKSMVRLNWEGGGEKGRYPCVEMPSLRIFGG